MVLELDSKRKATRLCYSQHLFDLCRRDVLVSLNSEPVSHDAVGSARSGIVTTKLKDLKHAKGKFPLYHSLTMWSGAVNRNKTLDYTGPASDSFVYIGGK